MVNNVPTYTMTIMHLHLRLLSKVLCFICKSWQTGKVLLVMNISKDRSKRWCRMKTTRTSCLFSSCSITILLTQTYFSIRVWSTYTALMRVSAWHARESMTATPLAQAQAQTELKASLKDDSKGARHASDRQEGHQRSGAWEESMHSKRADSDMPATDIKLAPRGGRALKN